MIEHWTPAIVGFLGIVLLIWGATGGAFTRPPGAPPRAPGEGTPAESRKSAAERWKAHQAPPLPPRIFTDTITLPRQRGNDPERERMLEELRRLQKRVRRLEGGSRIEPGTQ